MYNKTFKLSLCCLFGFMSISSMYANNSRSMNAILNKLNQKSLEHDKKLLKKRKKGSDQNDMSQGSTQGTGASTGNIYTSAVRMGTAATFTNAKNIQTRIDSNQSLVQKFASSHVTDSHATASQVAQLKAAGVSSDVIKLITCTKEGYIYEHLKTIDSVTSLTSIKDIMSSDTLKTYDGKPLESGDKDNNNALRQAYQDMVDKVVSSGTSRDFELLIASTGGTTDGKALASDGSNSHKTELQNTLNAVSVTIDGKTYTGLSALKEVEKKLQSGKLSTTEKVHLVQVESALSTKLSTAVETYRSNADSRGIFGGTAENDVYFNGKGCEEYTTELNKNSDIQKVQKMVSANQATLEKYGATSKVTMLETLAKNATTAKEEHELTTSAGLQNAYDEALKEIKSGNHDLETHVIAYTGSAQLSGDAAKTLKNALKTYYNNIPLTYAGIETALKVTGGTETNASHQAILREKYNQELSTLALISAQLKTATDPEAIAALKKQQEATASTVKQGLLEYATSNQGVLASNDVYLDYSTMEKCQAEREENFPEHFNEKLIESYSLHEGTTTAHTAAVNNAKKQTND